MKTTDEDPDSPPNAERRQGAWSASAGAIRTGCRATIRTVVPAARRMSSAIADWLVSIGWGKFYLLSALFLILSVLSSSLFFSNKNNSKPPEHGEIAVTVHVTPLANGDLQIGSTESADPNTVVIGPGHFRVKARPRSGASASADGASAQVEGDGDDPKVRIDRQGVRILADDEGGKAAVVIDHNGVRIEKIAPRASASQDSAKVGGAPAGKGVGASAPAGASLPAQSSAATPRAAMDPKMVAEEVDAARRQIATILQGQVDDQLEALRRGDESEREDWVATLAVLVIIAAVILKVVLGSKSKAESQARQASATAVQEGLKRQLAEAQLKTMQAQVEPHFLFNTLASVDHLIETDPARASRMQKNLIQYLRAALPQMREGSSNLGRELAQCRSYLEILKVRMEERLQFSINVPQGLQSAAFPPMMLLTLVENSIKHGLEPKPDGGSVSVSALVANGALQVAVADSGLGFGIAQRGGTGVGLSNIRERLQALFGAAARLQIETNTQGGTIAAILVPYQADASAVAGAESGSGNALGAEAGAAVGVSGLAG